MTLRVLPAARLEMLEAARWYEDKQPGLGNTFVAAIDATFVRIETGPHRFPVCYRQLRKALAHRFPYAIYFLEEGGTVFVFGVLHHRRDENILAARLDK